MAINAWWAGDPNERFWFEITDREELGADLYAPKTDQSGHETPTYTLVSHVKPGDVVLHWWKQAGQEKPIVGFSRAVGSLETTTIRWQSRGTYGRAQTAVQSRPAWRFPLADYTDLETPVTLQQLRTLEPALRKAAAVLASNYRGPLYLPFAFSDKRPLRTAQGYLVKFPRKFFTWPRTHFWGVCPPHVRRDALEECEYEPIWRPGPRAGTVGRQIRHPAPGGAFGIRRECRQLLTRGGRTR